MADPFHPTICRLPLSSPGLSLGSDTLFSSLKREEGATFVCEKEESGSEVRSQNTSGARGSKHDSVGGKREDSESSFVVPVDQQDVNDKEKMRADRMEKKHDKGEASAETAANGRRKRKKTSFGPNFVQFDLFGAVEKTEEGKTGKRRPKDTATATMAKQFFGYDWGAVRNQRLNPGKSAVLWLMHNTVVEGNFTPAVYWHYISMQYFPSSLSEIAKDPHAAFVEARSRLNSAVPLPSPGLDASCAAYSFVLGEQMTFNEDLETARREVKIEQLIACTNTELAQVEGKNAAIQREVAGRMKLDVLKTEISHRSEDEYIKAMEKKYQASLTLALALSQTSARKKRGRYSKGKSGPLCAPQKLVREDEAVCQVCNNGDYEASNLIVFCAVLFLLICE